MGRPGYRSAAIRTRHTIRAAPDTDAGTAYWTPPHSSHRGRETGPAGLLADTAGPTHHYDDGGGGDCFPTRPGARIPLARRL